MQLQTPSDLETVYHASTYGICNRKGTGLLSSHDVILLQLHVCNACNNGFALSFGLRDLPPSKSR